MVFSGMAGLALNNIATLGLEFKMKELWEVALIMQLSNVAFSVCVVISFFRFLHFLIHWEYIGILVITVFSMMDAIVRFVILFSFISIGFSSAFHLLYDNNSTYSSFAPSLLTTSISIFSAYQVPPYANLLNLPNAIMGYVFQVICVIIGVVLLLNFLIAMMATIYDRYQQNSTDEYRWIITSEINKLRGPNSWPVPFNIIQPPLVCAAYCCGLIKMNEEIFGQRILCDEDHKVELLGTMVLGHFGEKFGSTSMHRREQKSEEEEIAGMKKSQIDELAKYLSQYLK